MVNPRPHIPQPAPGRRDQTKPPKTVLILDWCGEQPIEYAVLNGDCSRFDRLYINRVGNDRKLEDEFSAILFDANGSSRLKTYKVFPYAAMGPNTKVIVAGFLP